MTDEEWLPIPEWEGLYSVSNRCRVRSEPRDVQRRYSRMWVRGCLLKPNAKNGVCLSRPGGRRSVVCHTIAAEVFKWT